MIDQTVKTVKQNHNKLEHTHKSVVKKIIEMILIGTKKLKR